MNFWLIIKVLVTLFLFTMVYLSIDFNTTLTSLKNLSYGYFILSIVVLTFQTFVASIRWQKVLKSLNINLPYFKVVNFQWIAIFFNQTLPSSIGGDAFRAFYIHQEGFKVKQSLLGVLLDRYLGVIGLTTIVFFTIPLLFSLINDLAARRGIFLIATLMAFLILIVFIFDFLTFLKPRWRVIEQLHSISKDARKIILTISPGISLVLISILVHLLSVLSIIILSYGIQANIDWSQVLLIVPLTTLVMIVPISIAGWGVREGMMVVGLGYMGVLKEEALALSLLYGFSMLILSFPGLIMWFLRYRLVGKNLRNNKLS